MSLKHRVTNTATPDLHEVGQYGTPEEIPNVRIIITPDASHYEDMQPLITADGAPIAATSLGSWGQLYAAGRPR